MAGFIALIITELDALRRQVAEFQDIGQPPKPVRWSDIEAKLARDTLHQLEQRNQ